MWILCRIGYKSMRHPRSHRHEARSRPRDGSQANPPSLGTNAPGLVSLGCPALKARNRSDRWIPGGACLRRSESSGTGQDVGHVEEGHVEDVEEGHVEHEHVEDGAAQAQGAQAQACVHGVVCSVWCAMYGVRRHACAVCGSMRVRCSRNLSEAEQGGVGRARARRSRASKVWRASRGASGRARTG